MKSKQSKGKKVSRLTLRRKLDRLTSLVVRIGAADKSGRVTCYTCPKRMHWKKAQAGHFQSRAKMSIRWDYERNIRPQCGQCNMRGGEQYRFARRLDKENGKGYALKVEQAGEKLYKYSTNELILLVESLENKLKKCPL